MIPFQGRRLRDGNWEGWYITSTQSVVELMHEPMVTDGSLTVRVRFRRIDLPDPEVVSCGFYEALGTDSVSDVFKACMPDLKPRWKVCTLTDGMSDRIGTLVMRGTPKELTDLTAYLIACFP